MDLGALGIRDGAVAAYLSLGVLEHDPVGLARLLAEARGAGRLLVSVTAFDGPTHIQVFPRIGLSSRSGPPLCCDITPALEGAPEHSPHQAGHHLAMRSSVSCL
jgi:hypothetical protein